MKRILSSAVLIVSQLLICIAVNAQPLILQTEISPNGETIAFTYQGDIWTVDAKGGRANRLTIHEGYESRPSWDNNSKQIAFSSDRFGSTDVFIIDANGGMPKQLTFHSSFDSVTDFAPNNTIMFASRRTYAQVEREAEIMAVDVAGQSTEVRFMDALGLDATMSPNGKKVAFVRGTARVSREDYRGPANRNIWIYDIEKNTYTQLTTFKGTDFMPKWIDNSSLYFISPRSGKYNVHKAELNGKITQITKETDFGINHFSTTDNGRTIVYQAGDEVVSFDVRKKRKKTLDINVTGDFRFDPNVARKTTNGINQYAVSPDGKLSAYTMRGDIYITRNDEKDERSVNLTQGPSRDRDVTWLNDNTLLFVSDKEGQNDIYMLKSSDIDEENLFASLKHKVTKLTNTAEDERNPVVSPDGKQVAYLQGRGKLITAQISDEGVLSDSLTLLDGWDTPSGLAWSPDSTWLAYSLSDLNFNEEIYIHAADNSSAPVNVSMHPRYDVNPVWSPDGTKLGFSSMRNNGDFDIWFAWLNKKDWQRSTEEWKRLSKMDKPKNDKKDDKKKDKNDELKEGDEEGASDDDTEVAETKKITIDFDDIYLRLVQVTQFAGNEDQLVFDQKGEHIYYSIGGSGRQNYQIDRSLYKIKWNGEDKKTVLKGNVFPRQLSLSNKGKHVFALTQRGKLVRIDTKSDKSKDMKVVSNMKIDYANEREQIFADAWRALNDGFYDPNFHGKDWDALRKKYEPLALKASTHEDFQYIFNLMLGQLNASHMGLSSGDNPKETQDIETGLLGIEGSNNAQGYTISKVLPNSPAHRDESKLEIGDTIVSVNQQSVLNQNFHALLNGQVNTPVLLEVMRGAQQSTDTESTTEEVVIWPVSSLRNELYDDWVNERRRLTEKYSNGRLGYLHIRGMNWSSFERFERELMAAGYGKDGIVIDVRYNGGGWTTDYLMAVLNVKQHSYTIPRGAAEDLEKEHRKFKDTYPFSERLPLSAWTKPSVAISNENSYSNAEIFSHAYKALGLGKLIGRPTFGAVISTGSYGLVDGSRVRMPFRGWWVKESGENMDFVPAMPDIEVFNPPAYKALGEDPQLERAVEELMKSL
ncbi:MULTISPECIES: S41 family peptidase [Alteromonadaceae]|uniref:Tricorn protease homolog n=1 Tax=Brumicola blandensis TaxID=3075611 RepID=A0AAW8R6R1_9ALTE|nr:MULTISPECIES: S41 family peptidase [unclassified Alteromonas]MDT0583690.1 S41 family peptidase [Alteromonas sp. W409]MDT0629185.1 S41 family peptidase [Alteromonas sp. W364]